MPLKGQVGSPPSSASMSEEVAIIQRYIAVREVPGENGDTYSNERPLTTQPTGRAVFGGLLLSQSISAASATVAPNFHIYSSNSTFLRPVTATSKENIIYHVKRVADGQSYATRLVYATQGDRDVHVFIATICFQNSGVPGGNVLDYGPPMPDLECLEPLDIPEELNRMTVAAASGPGSPLQPLSSEIEPFDRRPFGFVLADRPSDCRVRCFVRSQNPLTTRSAEAHLAALAYMSDEIFLGMALFANPEQVGDKMRNITMAATLGHNIMFHDPTVKVDEWMVFERVTSWGAGGRVLVHQQTWDLKTGRLIMTCSQEALIRLKDIKDGSKL